MANPRRDFYDYALTPSLKSQLKIEKGEKQATFMSQLQRQHETSLAKLRPKADSPFLMTLHARWRTVAESKVDPMHYVWETLNLIDGVSSHEQFSDVVRALHHHGVKALFSLDHDPDLENPSVNIFYLRFQDPNLVEGPPDKEFVRRLYKKFGQAPPKFSLKRFEDSFTKFMPPKYERQNPKACFNLVETDNLPRELLWLHYYLLPGEVDRFSVDSPSYFGRLGRMLRDRDLFEKWKGYFRYLFLDHVSQFFSDTRDLMAKINREKPGPWWLEKVSLSTEAWWQDAGKQFVESDRKYLEQARYLARSMTHDLVHILRRQFEQSSWQPKTKDEALRKLDSMKCVVGWSRISFGTFPTIKKSAPFDVAVDLGWQFQHNWHWKHWGTPAERCRWRWVPYCEVNAFYSREGNCLFVPASLFYPPFLDLEKGQDSPENWAGFGSIVAHEILHGFDYDSQHVDADGGLRFWWAPRDFDHFQSQVVKLKSLYAAKRKISGNRKHDGRLTLSENLADWMALDLTWRAWVFRWRTDRDEDPPVWARRAFFTWFAVTQVQIYTPDLLKFVRKHDVHAQAKARVNLPLSGFDPFLSLYGVGADDPMFTPENLRPQFLVSPQ